MLDDNQLRDAIFRGYGIRARVLEPLHAGVVTTNFRATTDAAELFVKAYPIATEPSGEAAALSLGMLARERGVPVPEVLATLRGELVFAENGGVFSVHRWCEGRSLHPLDVHAAASAGAALGAIHRAFVDLPESSHASPRVARFLSYDAAQRRDGFEHLRSVAQQRREDAFAQRAAKQLERRLELISRIPITLPRLAGMPTQVGHGDSSVLNFLFAHDGAVTGVVDFRPPEPYFRDFELSRIALDPETMVHRVDWREIATAALGAYLDVFPVARVPSTALGPALWLCHLLRSDFGVKQHLLEPHPTQQPGLDHYWECRCGAAEILLGELDSWTERIEALIARSGSPRP